jgi:hypothetical protein
MAIDTYGSWKGHGKPVKTSPRTVARFKSEWGNRGSNAARGLNTSINTLGGFLGNTSAFKNLKRPLSAEGAWGNQSSDFASGFNNSLADISSAVYGGLNGGGSQMPAPGWKPGLPGDYSFVRNRTFGNPRTTMASQIQNAITKAQLGMNRSDLLGTAAMTLGDIERAGLRHDEQLKDNLNARGVWDGGIKQKTLGDSVGDRVRYKGRTRNALQRGLRNLSLSADQADLRHFQTDTNSALGDADRIRASVAAKVKEFSV